ncbi:hypothetical protein CAC42_3949 [Sphaceloma murrayae]|uniref:Pentatricopeptide repeat domain-containing protein n=1 Tax=Sphaceloma murrayae TaxID=2082308 RepID=A0A2K1QST3_9PEZI|nr:hypothetical protein CAC42_3949 [Sphaceloma murrayae]
MPTEGESFDPLWSGFVKAFLDDACLLKHVLSHAADLKLASGRPFHFLYRQIMDHYIIKDPVGARDLFDHMAQRGLVPEDCISPFIGHLFASTKYPDAVRLFKHMYITGKERSLYERFIDAMKKAKVGPGTMQRWHRFLVKQGDLPSPQVRSSPEVETLLGRRTARSKRLAAGLRASEQKWIAEKQDAQDPFDPDAAFTRERLSSVIGEIHGIKQKSVTDAFCARVFATGGISTGFMIGALAMFGLDTVGPLSLRELAARGETVDRFRDALRALRERKIAVTECVFSRALRKFANEGRQDLFESIIYSDRHPETYEQRDVLERLVEADLLQDRTTDAHALLAILVMSDRNEHNAQWNSLLKAEARNRRRDKVKGIVQEMLLQGQRIRDYTVHAFIEELLPLRRPGKGPQTGSVSTHQDTEALQFVMQLCLAILTSGQNVPLSSWRELMTRYGMTGRMKGLRSLSCKLAEHYLRPSSTDASTLGKSDRQVLDFDVASGVANTKLSLLFNPIMQRAIVAWGFQSAHTQVWLSRRMKDATLSEDERLDKEWLEGIKLLSDLRSIGVNVSVDLVRREVISRLGILYTPGVSTVNSFRALKSRVKGDLSSAVDSIQSTWGANGLFKLPDEVTNASPDERSELLYKHLFRDSGWLRKSQRALAKKWKTHTHVPRRHVRPLDRQFMNLLVHNARSIDHQKTQDEAT